MNNKEKIEMLEEILELDEGTLKEETVLDDIQEWDSMAALSLIVLVDDEFGKRLSGAQIRALNTVKDILDIME